MTTPRERPSRLMKLGFKVPMFRVLEPDEAVDVIAASEREHPGTARRTLPRMLEGYDFGPDMRHELAQSGTVVAFKPIDD